MDENSEHDKLEIIFNTMAGINISLFSFMSPWQQITSNDT
jgi:hypothetical protein